ncbi:hypothetical protein HDU80_005230 [Chytriomyces hyalinus]|nr:hypothetical protein HDU80_005230 [Chytriomyces hyalinus]
MRNKSAARRSPFASVREWTANSSEACDIAEMLSSGTGSAQCQWSLLDTDGAGKTLIQRILRAESASNKVMDDDEDGGSIDSRGYQDEDELSSDDVAPNSVSLLASVPSAILLQAVNWPDLESKYTAMHELLYAGKLSCAVALLRMIPDIDLNARDKDGLSCFDLLDLSFERNQRTIQEARTNEDEDSGDEFTAAADAVADPLSALPVSTHHTGFSKRTCSTSVWTWGSNSNLQLGHSNTNNRAFPERLEIAPHLYLSDPVSIQNLHHHHSLVTKLSMSKYHTVIATDSHLYSFGFGSGGRLGLGHNETTLLPSLVRGFEGSRASDSNQSPTMPSSSDGCINQISDSCKISCIATGPDHTMVVTDSGRVFTWGSNKWGQLGYATDSIRDEMKPSLSPVEVGGVFKKVKIIGAAAAKYHSVAFSNNGLLFTWGWNIGQLGYSQPPNTTQLQQTPRKVTAIPQGEILAVAATNNSTALLINRGEVHVISNNQTHRVSFTPPPILSAFANVNNSSVRQSAKHSTSAGGGVSADYKTNSAVRIVKIVSGNHQYVGMTGEGDIYMWCPPVEVEEFKNTWQQQNFPQSRPKRIWSAHGAREGGEMAAKDVAVGIDSTVLVRTENGHVYMGTKRKEVKFKESSGQRDIIYFKFKQVPYLQNIQSVYASISGAFAAIRVDELPSHIQPRASSLREDLRKVMISQPHEEPQPETSAGEPFIDVRLILMHCEEEYAFEAHSVILASRSPFFRRVIETMNSRTRQGKQPSLNNLTDAWEMENGSILVSIEESFGSPDDVPNPSFDLNFGNSAGVEPEVTDRVLVIRFLNAEYMPKALGSLLELIYTGSFSRNWESQEIQPAKGGKKSLNGKKTTTKNGDKKLYKSSSSAYVTTQSDFYILARLFELEQTSSISGISSLERYCESFASCLHESSLMRATADVVLELEEGTTQFFAHRVFLAARSPFFDAMLGSGSQWMLVRKNVELPNGTHVNVVVVDLGHWTLEVMRVVMEWLYTDAGFESIAANLSRGTLLEYLRLLIDILSCANEFLLERLKEQVSSVLRDLLDLSNVVELLEVADMYDAKLLKESCLDFICWNLSTLIESHMLDDAPEGLLKDMEAALQLKQQAKFPQMRSPDGFYARIKTTSAQLDRESKLFYSSPIAREDREKFHLETLASRARLDQERALARSKEFKANENAAKHATRMNSSPQTMFDLELESPTMKNKLDSASSGKAGKKKDKQNWKKIDLGTPVASTAVQSVNTIPDLISKPSISSLKGWGSAGAAVTPAKVSLSDIMKETEKKVERKSSSTNLAPASSRPVAILSDVPTAKNSQAGQQLGSQPATVSANILKTPTKRAVSAAIAVPEQMNGSPVNAAARSWGTPSNYKAASASATSPFSVTAPLSSSIPSDSLQTVPIKVSTKKSQKERKRESTGAVAGASNAPTPSLVAHTPPSAWTIPDSRQPLPRFHEQENEEEPGFDFWSSSTAAPTSWKKGDGNRKQATGASPRLATSWSQSPTKVSAIQFASSPVPSAPPARPTLSEIQEEEMRRRKTEIRLRENIKNTSFAEIQKEELELKELQEQFGVRMVFQNGEWQVTAAETEVAEASEAAATSSARKSGRGGGGGGGGGGPKRRGGGGAAKGRGSPKKKE